MAQKETVAVEKVVDNVVVTVNSGKTGEFFRQLWETHQADILHFGKVLLLSLLVILIAWLFTRIARRLIYKAVEKIAKLDESIARVLYVIARTVIWLFAFLIVLDLFGINTASILTVLGACGLAVGLAMKDSLSNIAAGIMLLILRPYKLGDYVECGGISGTIKQMGLFSTILVTPDGLFISAPNSQLFGAPIKNYSRNEKRRVDITVGISYGDSLTKGLEVLQALMEKNDLVLKDPAPQVLVQDLADSSVNLTLRFWTNTADYWTVYWQIKEGLKNAIESAGLNIPFPQRVVTFANAIPQQLENK